MNVKSPITAGALIIGDEILSGRTKDRNIGLIAEHLTAIGIELKEVRVVGDDSQSIVDAINALRPLYTYVFTSGGIGPTHDDITADSVARAFGVSLEVDHNVAAQMKAAYELRGLALNSARLRMARIPVGARLVPNSVSVAPGFQLGNVIVMAGVPAILEAMLKEATKQLQKGPLIHSRSIIVEHAEGEIADLFAAHQSKWPYLLMGSYPTFQNKTYATELVLRGHDVVTLERAWKDLQVDLSASNLKFRMK